jgi:hypothetical protein
MGHRYRQTISILCCKILFRNTLVGRNSTSRIPGVVCVDVFVLLLLLLCCCVLLCCVVLLYCVLLGLGLGLVGVDVDVRLVRLVLNSSLAFVA